MEFALGAQLLRGSSNKLPGGWRGKGSGSQEGEVMLACAKPCRMRRNSLSFSFSRNVPIPQQYLVDICWPRAQRN